MAAALESLIAGWRSFRVAFDILNRVSKAKPEDHYVFVWDSDFNYGLSEITNNWILKKRGYFPHAPVYSEQYGESYVAIPLRRRVVPK